LRGVFLDLDSLSPADLDLTELDDCLDAWHYHPTTSAAETGSHIAAAQVVVTNKVELDARHLSNSPDLQLVCVAATGANNIDLEAASAAGITVSNARNYATASVTEAVFAMLLTLTRRLDNYRQQVSFGAWSQSPQFCLFGESIQELQGKTLGIIGHGVLGSAVASLARAFSMRVLVAQRLHGPPVDGRVPLPELIRESDVISLHCPLSEFTRHLIGPEELRAMKPGAILINTARGGIVDEVALVEALKHGWIAGAAIDVVAEEPPPADNCLLNYQSPNLILTPHIAWASRAARQRLIGEIAENIRAFRSGSPRNQVN
jgi:glycerate dehydrogenase